MGYVPAFNARMISNISFDKLYRVYPAGGQLYFIRIGGQGGIWEGLTHQLGLVGLLLESRMKKRADRKERALTEAFDATGPEQLLPRHADNLRLAAVEIADGTVDPPSFFATHGPHVGRWQLTLRDGRKMNFQFERTEDMRVALDVLSELFAAALLVNVRWNESKKAYEKKGDAA